MDDDRLRSFSEAADIIQTEARLVEDGEHLAAATIQSPGITDDDLAAPPWIEQIAIRSDCVLWHQLGVDQQCLGADLDRPPIALRSTDKSIFVNPVKLRRR